MSVDHPKTSSGNLDFWGRFEQVPTISMWFVGIQQKMFSSYQMKSFESIGKVGQFVYPLKSTQPTTRIHWDWVEEYFWIGLYPRNIMFY